MPKKKPDEFLKSINQTTEKDPRKSASYDHDKAFQQLKDQSTPIKTKFKKDIKY